MDLLLWNENVILSGVEGSDYFLTESTKPTIRPQTSPATDDTVPSPGLTVCSNKPIHIRSTPIQKATTSMVTFGFKVNSQRTFRLLPSVLYFEYLPIDSIDSLLHLKIKSLLSAEI
jgi:hypothetical protein